MPQAKAKEMRERWSEAVHRSRNWQRNDVDKHYGN